MPQPTKKTLKPKITDSWVDWNWNPETNKDHFYRYTRYSDDSIMGEPITKRQYLKEKNF